MDEVQVFKEIFSFLKLIESEGIKMKKRVIEEELEVIYLSAGEGSRTPERLREQILSLSPLTTWLPPQGVILKK